MITVASRENFNSEGIYANNLPNYNPNTVGEDIFYYFCHAEEPGDLNSATNSIVRDIESPYISKLELLSGESHAVVYGNYVQLYKNPEKGEKRSLDC